MGGHQLLEVALGSFGRNRWVRLCDGVSTVEGFFFFFNGHGLGFMEVDGFHSILWAAVGRLVMVDSGNMVVNLSWCWICREITMVDQMIVMENNRFCL